MMLNPRKTAGQQMAREAVQTGTGDRGARRKKNWSLGKLEMWRLKELCGATENPTDPQKVNTLLGFAGDNTLIQ